MENPVGGFLRLECHSPYTSKKEEKWQNWKKHILKILFKLFFYFILFTFLLTALPTHVSCFMDMLSQELWFGATPKFLKKITKIYTCVLWWVYLLQNIQSYKIVKCLINKTVYSFIKNYVNLYLSVLVWFFTNCLI